MIYPLKSDEENCLEFIKKMKKKIRTPAKTFPKELCRCLLIGNWNYVGLDDVTNDKIKDLP